MSTKLGYPSIAFVGKAGSGKTTATQIVHELAPLQYTTVSFATPLKKTAVEMWGPGADRDRAKLQALGKAIRAIDPYTFARIWVDSASVMQAAVTTDDLRFENEWWPAKGLGLVTIRVVASRALRIDRLKASGKFQSEEQLDDSTETAIDHLDSDYTVVNDGDKFGLADQLVAILNKESRKR